MSISKIIILTLFTLSINTISQSQETVNPVKFEREATVSVDVPPDDLFDLLGPRGARLINKSEVDFLYGSEEDMDRAMFRIKGHSGSWVWYAVGNYDPKQRIYTSTILMPEDEYWLNQYQVESNGKGGSLFTMRWRITGFNDKTNSSIQAFLDYEKTTPGQDFKQRVQRTADALVGYLKSKETKGNR